MRPLLLCLLLVPALLHAQSRGGEVGGVYVAGDGFTLEQAAEDALRERGTGRQAVAVIGPEVARLVAVKATPRTLDLAQKLQAAGIPVYACERDVRALGVFRADLVGGVRVERGWTRLEASEAAGERLAAKDGTPEGQLRRLRRLCAEG
jgi:intracellular sulfur oxidation DsrE/DsrF family protein